MALIILAHPSFEQSIANKAIIEELSNSNLPLEVRDIHHLYPDYKIDVAEEQKILLKHRTIVFQYPFYWYSVPGILKHWIDVVFEYGFAYGSSGDKLKGKNLLPSFTVGSSASSYTALGFQHFRVYEYCKQMEQTAYFTQMNYIEPVFSYENSRAAGYAEAQIKTNARRHARKLIDRIRDLDKFQLLNTGELADAR